MKLHPKEDLFFKAIRIHKAKSLVEKMNEFEERTLPSSNRNTRRTLMYSTLMAACLAFFLVINWDNWFGADYNHPYLQDHFNEFVQHNKSRSLEQATTVETKWKGYDLYVIKAFKEAIPHLKTEWEANRDELSLFYLGVAYCGSGKVKKAQEVLEQIENAEHKTALQVLLDNTR